MPRHSRIPRRTAHFREWSSQAIHQLPTGMAPTSRTWPVTRGGIPISTGIPVLTGSPMTSTGVRSVGVLPSKVLIVERRTPPVLSGPIVLDGWGSELLENRRLHLRKTVKRKRYVHSLNDSVFVNQQIQIAWDIDDGGSAVARLPVLGAEPALHRHTDAGKCLVIGSKFSLDFSRGQIRDYIGVLQDQPELRPSCALFTLPDLRVAEGKPFVKRRRTLPPGAATG